jgi:hypothetical protein
MGMLHELLRRTGRWRQSAAPSLLGKVWHREMPGDPTYFPLPTTVYDIARCLLLLSS